MFVRAHKDARLTYYPTSEQAPSHRGVQGDWAPLVFKTAGPRRRTVRAVYEICTFQALREQLRCRNIWVVGADRHRNPDADLPRDFDQRRAEHYEALRKPLDPSRFINDLREEMQDQLSALDRGLPGFEWVEIGERGKQGAIRLTPFEAVAEPVNLRRLKSEIVSRWGTVPLIDMLKEALIRTNVLSTISPMSTRRDLSDDTLAMRLVLAIYAYGTNTGIRAIASSGRHGHSERDTRYVRGRYLNAETARAIAIDIADATFTGRDPSVWGAGSTAVASDSTHFRAFDQNIFTEWHSRYGGRGVLIYWHVERKSVAIHSQLLNCSASEVAAMIEVGRAQKTAFIARYLHDRDLQREINEGLNVVESWNRANSVLFYGKGGDIATNRRDEQELSVLCLRVLQASLVYVNTLMVQQVLAEPEWSAAFTPADRRGLTPLFRTHVAPYGRVELDMTSRLALL